MRRLRFWTSRIVGLLTPGRRERELSNEIDCLVQLQTDERRRAGLPAEEARRQALIAIGGQEAFKDSYREAWSIPLVDGFMPNCDASGTQIRSTFAGIVISRFR